jgi:polyisoprenoid-binding protein YceI
MTRWSFDTAHSTIEFSVRHMMVTTVRGTFGGLQGFIDFDPSAPAAAYAEGTVETATVSTRDAQRDAHLRSADFFDVENHAHINFKSTAVQVVDAANAKVTGDLTIRGTTRPVTFDVEFFGTNKNPWGKTVAAFNATTKLQREDFGLTWNVALETGGVLVGKEVTLSLELQLIPAEELTTA